MARYFFLVETTCNDPSREDEFNDWYSNVHIPDMAEAGGIGKATRLQLAKPAEGRSKYLSIYEIECDDFGAWAAKVGAILEQKDPERAYNASLATVDTRTVYTPISTFPGGR